MNPQSSMFMTALRLTGAKDEDVLDLMAHTMVNTATGTLTMVEQFNAQRVSPTLKRTLQNFDSIREATEHLYLALKERLTEGFTDEEFDTALAAVIAQEVIDMKLQRDGRLN